MDKSFNQKSQQYQLQTSLKGDVIDVELSIFGEEIVRHYKGDITFLSLPLEIRSYFQNIQNIFQLFSDTKNYQIDAHKGQIEIHTFSYNKGKNLLIQKQTSIKLTEIQTQEIQRYEYLLKNVQKLKKTISNLSQKQIKNQKDEKQELISETLNKMKQKIEQLEVCSEKIIEYEEKEFNNEENPQNFKKNSKQQQQKVQKDEHIMHMVTPKQPLQNIFSIIKTTFSSKFDISGGVITYKGENNKWTQLLLNIQLQQAMKYRFCFLIKSTTSQYIIIGLVDESKQKNSRCSFKTINAVGYNGKTKSIYYNKGETKVQGKGFKKGDKVSMQVNIQKQAYVRWYVNDVQTAFISDICLLKECNKLVPYVQLGHTEDSVQFLC